MLELEPCLLDKPFQSSQSNSAHHFLTLVHPVMLYSSLARARSFLNRPPIRSNILGSLSSFRALSSSPPPLTIFKRNDTSFTSPSSPPPLIIGNVFHTCYWWWYTTSFAPTLIAANVGNIDERVGFVGEFETASSLRDKVYVVARERVRVLVARNRATSNSNLYSLRFLHRFAPPPRPGLGLSIMMTGGAFIYSTRLVSKVLLLPSKKLEIYTHTIPFGRPSPTSKETLQIGECSVELSKDADPKISLSPGAGYQPFKRSDDTLASFLLDIENGTLPSGREIALETLVFGRQSSVKDVVAAAAAADRNNSVIEKGTKKKGKRKRYNPKQQNNRRK